MRTKLIAAAAAAAIAVVPLAPVRASDSNICASFADPYSRVCWTVIGPFCQEPWPPLSICN